MNFNVRYRRWIESRDFLVAKVRIAGASKFFDQVLIHAKYGRTRGVAGEILVAIFFADEKRVALLPLLSDAAKVTAGFASPYLARLSAVSLSMLTSLPGKLPQAAR